MRREIKVGLTVIMGIGLAYLSLAWLNRSSLFAPPEKQYFLQFQQVNGLLEGDPVVVRGYQAGRVTNILPASEAVSVEIVLDERIPIFADALAEIQIKELMGGKQIALQTGKTGAALAEGATITGQTSLDFSTAFSRFGGVMDQVAPENVERFSQRIDSIATSWNAAIDPQTLSSIIQNLDRITTRLDQQTAQIPVNTLVEETQTTFSEVKGLLAQTSSLLSKLDQISTRLDSSFLGQGESLLSEADQSLGQLNQLMGEAQSLLSRLESSETFAGRALNDPAFAAKIDSTLWHLNRTLGQIHDQKVIVGLRRK